jgi:protein-S-isoprenylcysteine O-methyltransferase Ste14
MKRTVIFIYGLICYLIGAATYFLVLSSFLANIMLTKTIDSGIEGSFTEALLVNLGLLVLFGLPHSLMARRKFKQEWTRIVPPAAERSTYMLQASLLLLLLMWQWRPMPVVVWHVDDAVANGLLWMVFWLGWLIAFISTFLINHFELTGLQQVYAYWRGKEIAPPKFRTPFLYKIVRHPLQFGFLLACWSTPHMTAGHLIFALGMTGYILIGLYFEERDLARHFGNAYREYQQTTPMLIPILRLGAKQAGQTEHKVRGQPT